MARFNELTMTDVGRAALAESIATSTPLVIDYIAIGDGFLPDGVTRESMTSLVNHRLDAKITGKQFHSDGTVTISATVNNNDIPEEISVRELGIPAKTPSGATVLFGYDNAAEGAGILPEGGGSNFVSHHFRVGIIIGNAENVVINVDISSDIRLGHVVDRYTTVANQRNFTPRSTNLAGALTVIIEGAVTFDWQIVGNQIQLADPLPAGRNVWIQEVQVL